MFLAALGQREMGAGGPERLTQEHYVEMRRQAVRVVVKAVATSAVLTAALALLAA